jgi:hypothetical protein
MTKIARCSRAMRASYVTVRSGSSALKFGGAMALRSGQWDRQGSRARAAMGDGGMADGSRGREKRVGETQHCIVRVYRPNINYGNEKQPSTPFTSTSLPRSFLLTLHISQLPAFQARVSQNRRTQAHEAKSARQPAIPPSPRSR